MTGRVVGSCGCQSRPASPQEGSTQVLAGETRGAAGDARQAVLGVAQWPQVSRDPRKHRCQDTLSALGITTWTWQCLPGSERAAGEFFAIEANSFSCSRSGF